MKLFYNSDKKKYRIAQIMVMTGCIAFVCAIFFGCYSIVKADGTISMTEFYNNGTQGTGYEAAKNGKTVTISSVAELKNFFECLKLEKWSSGINFCQTADIKLSDYTFSYNGAADRFGIYQGGNLLGTVNRKEELYANYTSSQRITKEALGLGDAHFSMGKQKFYGNYDGQGYTISGFVFSGPFDSYYAGLFGSVENGASVMNLTLRNGLLMNSYGVFAGVNDGIIKKCVSDHVIGYGAWVGGISESNMGSIEQCKVTNCEIMPYSDDRNYIESYRVAGITAGFYGGTVKNCLVENTILRGLGSENISVGGICAVMKAYSSAEYNNIENCTNRATLSGGTDMGGIIGKVINEEGARFGIANCRNEGNLTEALQEVRIGGIIGAIDTGVSGKLIKCVNTGSITRGNQTEKFGGSIGGIVGQTMIQTSLSNCYNEANIYADDTLSGGSVVCRAVGGILGSVKAEVTVLSCGNRGTVKAARESDYDYAGGIAGKMENSSVQQITNSYSTGNIYGGITGGLVGSLTNATESGTELEQENCYNAGTVSGTTIGEFAGTGNSAFVNCYTLSHTDASTLAATLNAWCVDMAQQGKGSYTGWRMEDDAYPVHNVDIDSFIDEDIYDEIEISPHPSNPVTSDMSDASPTPSVSTTPDISPTPDILPTPTASIAPEISPTPITSEKPDSSGDAGNQMEEKKSSATLNPYGNDSIKKVAISGLKKKLGVEGLNVTLTKSLKVKLTWKRNNTAKGYRIWRSTKKTSGYRLVKGLSNRKTAYLDKKVKKGKKYYYKIEAFSNYQGERVYGETNCKKIEVYYFTQPVIVLTKGSIDEENSYVQVRLKRYQGKNIEIYFKSNNKKYVKVQMKKDEIALYHGKFKFSYSKKKRTMYCMVRTYEVKKGKKRYSGYSDSKKISL